MNLLDDIETFYVGTFSETPGNRYSDITYKTHINSLKDSSIIIEIQMINYKAMKIIC